MTNHYLINLIERIKSKIINLRATEKGYIFFSIGTTSSGDNLTDTVITPTRKIEGGHILGVIVFSQSQGIIIAHEIDGMVDAFFVDAEKKLPLTFNPNYDLLDHFNLSEYKSDNTIEYGNISAVCSKIIKKSEYYQYKANDLSVDAVWHYMILNFNELSGKRFVIYGSGNIGNKIALKLVESGANVIMYSKYPNEANTVVNAINMIKNKHVLSNVTLSHHPLHAAVGADALIGCTNNVNIITHEMVEVMNPKGVVIDLGKGTIFDNAVEQCLALNIKTWRVDITAMLNGMIMNSICTHSLIKKQYGRTHLESDIYLVSGGYIGKKYDVIVDNSHSPREIFGICNSPGKVMNKLDKIARAKLALVEQFIKNKEV